MARTRRYDIKKLLQNPDLRRKLIVESTVAAQSREGIEVSGRQAEDSYYVVTEGERGAFFNMVPYRTEAGENDGRHVEFVRSLADRPGHSREDVALIDFKSIEGSPLAYDRLALIGQIFRTFPRLEPRYGTATKGLATTADSMFVRRHWELEKDADGWMPFAKGGDYCRFYNDVYLRVDWRESGKRIYEFLHEKTGGSPTRWINAVDWYGQPGLTWPRRTQRGFNVRKLPAGCIFADKGPAIFPGRSTDPSYLLGVLSSRIVELIIMSITSFGSWEVGAIKKIPIPDASEALKAEISSLAEKMHCLKAAWDTGNEICTRFVHPWIILREIAGEACSLVGALDAAAEAEKRFDRELVGAYDDLNLKVYSIYDINDKLRARIELALGSRPAEVIWPQMEGKDAEQKRREHVDRLLCYLIKKILEADEDGLVCMEAVAHEPPLLARLRKELHACFPQQDATSLEGEVLNELKKKVKGYRRAESLEEWVQDLFFDTHASLYLQRPLLWHLASSQTRRVPAFGVLVHSHKFGRDALAKLRSTHIRDRIATLKREAGQARQDGREDDRLQALADIEEVEAFDAKLKLLQEGAHRGPEGGPEDYRILTPWKSPSERPQGWDPDLDDGIKVNIAPLARTGLLRTKARFGEKDPED